MGNSHNRPFFGQSVALFVQSTAKNEPFIFIKCIRKKADDTWEKPSKCEGKTIKCGLEEIVMMLQVLKKKMNKWSTVHEFKDEKTQISMNWEEGEKQKLWINVATYKKSLNFSQAEILRLLLRHILDEKIEFATSGELIKPKNSNQDEVKRQEGVHDDKLEIVEEYITPEGTKKIDGIIKNEAELALLIQLLSGQEIWFPKSTIKSMNGTGFLVDAWFLQKQGINIQYYFLS